MLHSKKREAIIQWYNSLTTKGNVTSLDQFTDGSNFSCIVTTLRGETKEDNLATESVIFSETNIACNEEVITSVEEEVEASVLESVIADPFVIKDSDLTDTQKTYDDIRKFIDDFYHLQSSSLIDYGECIKGKDLELAKVAIFLLSAMVQTFLSSNNQVLEITTRLQMDVQENIRECLALVLDPQENEIKKSELHKVLCRAAIYKGTPARNTRSTPDPNDASESVKNFSKKRKERSSSFVSEASENSNSPLKTLLESPNVQRQAAVLRKDLELKKLRNALHDEENKVTELISEKQNLNDELEKKKKELEYYKKELKLQREALFEKEEQEKLRDEELKAKKMEAEKVRKLIESQEEDIKQLRETNEKLQENLNYMEKMQEQDTTTSLVKENMSLKKEIEIFRLDNEQKVEIIKDLSEKNRSLEIDLQKYQEFPNSRRERRSSEAGTNIIYADVQSRERVAEVKHEKTINDMFLASSGSVPRVPNKNECDMTDEGSRNDSQLQANVSDDYSAILSNGQDFEKGRSDFIKKVVKDIILKLEQKNCIPHELVKALLEKLPEINGLDGQVLLLRELPDLIEPLKDDSVTTRSRSHAGGEKKDANSLTISKNAEKKLKPTKADLMKDNERLSQKIVSAINEIVKLKEEAEKLRKESEESRKKSEESRKESEESRKESEESRKESEELRKEAEKFRKEAEKFRKEAEKFRKEAEKLKKTVDITQEKYIEMEKLAKKKDDDVKRALIMYQKIAKLKKIEKESKKECGEECEKLRRRCKQLNEVCFVFEQETGELKRSIKHLEGMMEHLQFEIKELKKEKKELEHKLWKETAALSRNTTDRDALVLHYLKKSKYEPKKNNDMELERKEKSSRPIVKVDAYILNSDNEPSMSNSVLASRSIRSSYFQVADEDDFLNESSLAEIHNGGIPEGESGEYRLLELQRRNTLCPPHLQSSYPLEIQNMTPSERKYYNPGEVSYDLDRKSSQYHGKRDIHSKQKSKYMENDSDEADDSHSFPVKKRKISETNCIPVPASKKHYKPSSSMVKEPLKDQEKIPRKPSTPLKRVAAFVKRQSTTFITPSSVNRLMKLQRKNKLH